MCIVDIKIRLMSTIPLYPRLLQAGEQHIPASYGVKVFYEVSELTHARSLTLYWCELFQKQLGLSSSRDVHACQNTLRRLLKWNLYRIFFEIGISQI